MDTHLAQDLRQRAADVTAVMVLARLAMLGAEPDFSRLSAIVGTACATESPETLQKYSAMDWQTVMREMKIAFVKHHLIGQQADPDQLPPPEVDEHIGKCLVAAFLKFVTFRSINPDWYAARLAEVRLGPAPL